MFEYLKGTLVRKDATSIVVEVGGIAYRCLVPVPDLGRFREGEVLVWTHARVTEEEFVLYGFATREARSLFETMIAAVPSLGPKRALAILSNIDSQELLEAVDRGDVALLKRIKGIGEKLAGRLVLELRGRLPRRRPETPGDASSDILREAALALVSLGYGRKEADNAVLRAWKEMGTDARLEDLIRRSLEHA